VSRYSDSSVAY